MLPVCSPLNMTGLFRNMSLVHTCSVSVMVCVRQCRNKELISVGDDNVSET